MLYSIFSKILTICEVTSPTFKISSTSPQQMSTANSWHCPGSFFKFTDLAQRSFLLSDFSMLPPFMRKKRRKHRAPHQNQKNKNFKPEKHTNPRSDCRKNMFSSAASFLNLLDLYCSGTVTTDIT